MGEALRAYLGVQSKGVVPRELATIAAQAFLHQSSAQRRTIEVGGNLREPLGDVNDSETLRKICVDLRMAVYEQRVAAKMREWGRLGTDISFQKARAADLNQYSSMCGAHVHGLDKPTFWGLWRAAQVGGYEKTMQFLRTANSGCQQTWAWFFKVSGALESFVVVAKAALCTEPQAV